MEVSSQANNYQSMNSYQQANHSIQPVPPQEPTYNNSEIYEASQGNLIRKDDEIALTPQGESNISNKQEASKAQESADTQAKKDAQRGYATGYLAHKSKQSQIEIYLSVATNSDVDLGKDTPSILESLRDVQKQNNSVKAYATYQENQKNGAPSFS